MYLKNLLVVALCTIFVVIVIVVVSVEAAQVGNQTTTVGVSSNSTCMSSALSCEAFSITSASLRVVNYTDELGPVGYTDLVAWLDVSGGSPMSSVNLFIGNQSAGAISGPFEPGVNKVVNITLPTTIDVSSGKTYLLSVEGFYGTGSTGIWESTEVKAE
ncbi:MAG TPA: hypothetical protein VEJ19_05385 [Nitrososphaerales archaeon]|nr:hypothetical protein [Nitrososphaerales archaeon]